jgi:hypothetical protein
MLPGHPACPACNGYHGNLQKTFLWNRFHLTKQHTNSLLLVYAHKNVYK